jgi:hypothetical protein
MLIFIAADRNLFSSILFRSRAKDCADNTHHENYLLFLSLSQSHSTFLVHPRGCLLIWDAVADAQI